MTDHETRDRESAANRMYWNELAADYQRVTRINCTGFHLGPLLPDAAELKLLPEVGGRRCLELGCGAGQNSIYLASRGARCVAVDVSDEQLAHGRGLAAAHKVEVNFRQASLDALPLAELGTFHFIHSTFALPFASDPAAVLRDIASLLEPGGTLLLSTAHPVFAGEWLEIEEEGEGLFLGNYFEPPPDVRFSEMNDGQVFICSRAYPLGVTIDWILDAGLTLRRLLEPRPLPIPTMSEAEIRRQVPYDSPSWRELYGQIARVPVVAVFLAVRQE